MKEEMEELHAEGLATHGDAESCAASREGRGEALTGARAGRAIEPRNVGIRGADAVGRAEGNTPGGASLPVVTAWPVGCTQDPPFGAAVVLLGCPSLRCTDVVDLAGRQDPGGRGAGALIGPGDADGCG
jgi:hypothetical protein